MDQQVNVTSSGPQLILTCALTCPYCGATSVETMPTDACIYFHECLSCHHALLRPKSGDCCVFCSYGSVRCPPVQQSAGCCQCGRRHLTIVDNRGDGSMNLTTIVVWRVCGGNLA